MRALATFTRRIVLATGTALTVSCGGGDGGPTGNNFTIQISVSPPSLTVQQGTSGTVTLTLVRGGGFADPVTATVSGLPPGVTVSVNPAQLTGSTTSALVTVDVAASQAPGVYTASVTATAAGVGSATGTYQLTVTPTPNYALSLSPAALPVQAGTSGNTTVGIARTNFTGTVALSVTQVNPAAAITGAFNPANAGGDNSTLTVTVPAAVTPGPYTLTIGGTGAPGTRTTTLALTVTAAANYSLSVNPNQVPIVRGQSSNLAVNITRTNFTGPVNLALQNPPQGVAGTFNPTSPTGNASTLTLVIGANAPLGTHTMTVLGTATGVPGIVETASLTRSRTGLRAVADGDRVTTFQLRVDPSGSITVSATAVAALQGGIGTSAVTLVRTNYTLAVNLAASGAPNGVTVTFEPAAVPGTTSTATVIVGAAVPLGTHPITVTGTGADILNATTTFNVQVSAAPAVFNAEYQFGEFNNPSVFAFQDGTGGPWTRVLPLFDAGTYKYRMNMTTGRGGVYYVDGSEAPAVQEAGMWMSELVRLAGLVTPERTASFWGFGNAPEVPASLVSGGHSGFKTHIRYLTAQQHTAVGFRDPSPKSTLSLNILNVPHQLLIGVDERTKVWENGIDPTLFLFRRVRNVVPIIASRYQMGSDIPDRISVVRTGGMNITLDALSSGFEPPISKSLFAGSAGSAPWGSWSDFNSPGRQIGFIRHSPTLLTVPSQLVYAPPVAQWGASDFAGLGIFQLATDFSTARFTRAGEFTWLGSGSLPFDNYFAPTLTKVQGISPKIQASFTLASGSTGPTKFVGISLLPQAMDGNSMCIEYSTEYLQAIGPGPTYIVTHPGLDEISGAPAASRLSGVYDAFAGALRYNGTSQRPGEAPLGKGILSSGSGNRINISF